MLPAASRPAFFELLGYSVKSAYQMNRKFLMAQRNHETGSADAAAEAREAFDSIQSLLTAYNSQLQGKWNQMMSKVPPGYVAKYHLMPELVSKPTNAYRLPDDQRHTVLPYRLDLKRIKATQPFRLIEGIGTEWVALQLGEPMDEAQNAATLSVGHIDIPFTVDASLKGDSICFCISVVPFWPIGTDRSNSFGVSLDGCKPVVCENKFTEWSFPWKKQVLENRCEFLLTFFLDRTRKRHRLTLTIGDPGQMVQGISYNCC
jgi:hypothetical protein